MNADCRPAAVYINKVMGYGQLVYGDQNRQSLVLSTFSATISWEYSISPK